MRTLTTTSVFVILALALPTYGQTTAFTYQGRLRSSGQPATGTCDFQFRLFDAAAGGTQQGPTLTFDGLGGNPAPISVAGGLFRATLEFGVIPFPGADRYLDIQARFPSGAGVYQTLTPRQLITSAPYSVTARTLGLPLTASAGAAAPTALLDLTNSGNGYGLRGTASGGGRGVEGIGATFVGVSGIAQATTGRNYGGAFQANGDTGWAVYGLGNHATGNNVGVLGQTNSPTNGNAVFSLGRFTATGVKAFQIDHPTDPENKYLNHYCAEGPQPFNIYRGHVVLGADGQAWAALPDYFGEINKDFEYQLTCIGARGQAYVAQEISGGRFLIAGDKPGLKISWMVTAVRDDRWVRAYGAPTVQEKPEQSRGTYLSPELYGQPREKGQFHLPEFVSPDAAKAESAEMRPTVRTGPSK